MRFKTVDVCVCVCSFIAKTTVVRPQLFNLHACVYMHNVIIKQIGRPNNKRIGNKVKSNKNRADIIVTAIYMYQAKDRKNTVDDQKRSSEIFRVKMGIFS